MNNQARGGTVTYTKLDEMAAFIADHVVATSAQVDAMTLYAAATHAMEAHVTFGRMLFAANGEESGKTVAMMVTASLSSNPIEASGNTTPALESALAKLHNEAEKPAATLYCDELQGIFGSSGLNEARGALPDILRRGYKRGATKTRSTNRNPEPYNIFLPFLMAGLGSVVPRDIRSRSIVVNLSKGHPKRYFDARESEPQAEKLARSVANEVRRNIPVISAFRARGIHHKLVARKLEVWEPLFAVANAIGGQSWLNRALSAFLELALTESDTVVLSPRQTVLRDLASTVAKLEDLQGESIPFFGGTELADELRRLNDPLYEGRKLESVGCLIRDTMPVSSQQRRLPNGDRVRGYPRAEILAAWEEVKPYDPDDVEVPEDEDPFAVIDDDRFDVPFDGTGVTGEVIREDNENGALASCVTGGTGGTGTSSKTEDRKTVAGRLQVDPERIAHITELLNRPGSGAHTIGEDL
jgi:hypothetical protein